MDTLQKELRDTYPALRIQFLGVNEQGQEAGNPSMTAGRVLPWLQDVDADSNGKSDVWYDSWNVTYRDVVILDGSNTKVGVYNVTVHDLATPENYAALRELLVDAAMTSQKPWQNAGNPLDVDNNQSVVALDALVIINRLNSAGAGQLPPPTGSQVTPPFYDCSGDNQVTALDALQVINFLNAAASASAGESEGTSSATVGVDAALASQATAWPVSVAGSLRQDAGNDHSKPTTIGNAATRPTAEASWGSRVDVALAAVADAGQGSLASPPIQRASFRPWDTNGLLDLQATVECQLVEA